MLDFRYEMAIAEQVVGVDEVGRGPLAGPVVAAAVYIPQGCWYSCPSLNDSKRLTSAQRERFSEWLQENVSYNIASAEVEEIDSINILQATKRAMAKAVDGLNIPEAFVLVDGNQSLDVSHKQQTLTGGDGLCMSIAAASILAKVWRDRLMLQHHEEFPYYGWDTNAGYGTKAHLAGIKQYGVCKHHRRSFAPVKAALAKREALCV